VWRALRRLSPARYSFFLEAAHGLALVGASPETLLSVVGGWAETHPIAGTRPRGADAAADAQLARRLLADDKERAEHTMLVDLGRNDLNRVCAPGSVAVPRLMGVRLFSHVMHLVSVVRGRLADGVTAADAFRAVFPAGTVSGAPKLMAVEHIYAREGARRGPYAGSVGYFDASGAADADTAIAIRSLVFVGEGDERRVCAQAGGGIVIDSTEEAEYQETLQKMAGPVAAVAHAEATSEAGGLAPTAPPASAASVAHSARLLLRSAPADVAPASAAGRGGVS
jgi:anthranilate synthase component 1